MRTKTLDIVFPILGIFLGLATAVLLTSCAEWKDLDTIQIVDAQGKTVYAPPGEVKKIVQIPSTGNPNVDYTVASVAAAVYGALGYWIRRVKKNGSAATAEISERLKKVENKTALLPAPTPPTTTQISMSDLVDLLHQLNSQKPGPPPRDGTAQ